MKSNVAGRLTFSFSFWGVLLSFISSFLFLMFTGGKLAFMLFIIISILSIYLLLGRWSGIASAKVSRSLMDKENHIQIASGTTLPVKMKVQIPGFWPIPYVFIKDVLLHSDGEKQIFENSFIPNWQRLGEVYYTIPPLRRGVYQFAETHCFTQDLFGLFEYRCTLNLPYSFSVLPQTVPLRHWQQFHLMHKGLQHHSMTTRALRETTQINGVREYIYGDRLSRIHWNATSKTGTLKSKEFERESLPKTVIVLDRQQEAYHHNDQFELAVSVAASILEYSAHQDLAFGLLSVGGDNTYFEPKRGSNHRQWINRHLIEVTADGSFPLLHVLQNQFRSFASGTFFAIITPQKDEEMQRVLKWMTHQQMNACHLWIDINHTTAEREVWLREVQRKGFFGYSITSLQELPLVLGGQM